MTTTRTHTLRNVDCQCECRFWLKRLQEATEAALRAYNNPPERYSGLQAWFQYAKAWDELALALEASRE